ncbi:hypothetical protein ENUP19_0083G0081 [Entamoeba nuttalli]|uniref:Uncharacterized protein n=2 Tax=Entamoeba nuttalli TaxID=412467 RepID=K2GZB4_ENTNP|nr:hypothetical protein ENU1_086570 [Entamoeba nuttalli P19]EKE40558.1 hypothetical protein ENU1_086570 [Entamoeba nuttalli P19]|eukprot:XP_008857109.1 hypothetical protein ENU1_086570 [Entamoeba nuttalli P19]
MSWILFYDQPNITSSFTAKIKTSHGIAQGPFYPQPEKNKNEIIWKGMYLTDKTGRGKIEINGKNYLYLFYNSDCLDPSVHFEGETFVLTRKSYLQQFTLLMEKMGLSVVEENDMITTWTLQMEEKPFTLLTIISPESLNQFVPLHVDGFEQYHRVVVAIEQLNSSQLTQAIKSKTIKQINEVTPRIRPTGKCIVEWGGFFTSEYQN